MSTNPFQLGQQASASAFMAALTALQSQGASVLKNIETAQLETLVEFDRRIQAIGERRARALRVASPEQAIKFVVSDFTDIDQANTTCTVRADSTSVSLRERAEPAEAVIRTNNFSANKGTIQALDSAQDILRVGTDDFSIPTGQFDITLTESLELSQFIIDIVATPSTPTIVVSVSNDGVTYTPATSISIQGYVVTVYLSSMELKYIRIQITPAMPDNLNGNTFTFGITNFTAQATTFQLRSDFLSKTIQFFPQSEFVVFDAISDSRIQYYLSIYEVGVVAAPFTEVNPGDAIQIGTLVSNPVTTNASFPYSLGALPSNTYLNTLKVTENGVEKIIAPGLLPTDLGVDNLQKEYVVLIPTSLGYDLALLNGSQDYNPPRTFQVSYVFGPEQVNVQLKVRLTTNDEAVSPVFTGATLDQE